MIGKLRQAATFKLLILIGGLVAALAGVRLLAVSDVACVNVYSQGAQGHPQASGQFSSWDEGNFHYEVMVYGIQADGSVRSASVITSDDCSAPGSYPGERVYTGTPPPGYPDIRWNSAVGPISPIGVRLGVPRSAANNNGAWMNPPIVGLAPTIRPPVYQNPQQRGAAKVDDGGLAMINGQVIWCLGKQSSRLTPAQRAACQDITTVNPPNGAGYMLVNDNCVDGADADGRPIRCNDGDLNGTPDSHNFNWYGSYYNPGAGYSSPDLTGLVGTNPDGTLRDFDLHMEAVQTQSGGFGSFMYVTYRYPRPFNMQATLRTGSGPYQVGATPPASYTITPGPTYELIYGTRNTGLGDSGNVSVEMASPGVASYVPGPGPPNCTAPATSVCGTTHWESVYSGVPPGGVQEAAIRFTVPSNAPDGAIICFQSHVAPMNNSGGEASSGVICLEVDNPRFPYLTTAKGDIHAGGGIGFRLDCTAGSGSIRGQVPSVAASTAEYVLSAGSSITNLVSGNGTGSLTLGAAGNYGKVCRPDLKAAANDYMNRYGFVPTGGGPILDPAAQDRILQSLSSITISGTASPLTKRLTLYVEGDLFITGNVAYSTTAPLNRRTIPGFGVIVAKTVSGTGGNIYIAPGVTQLDGYYFAEGEINTCSMGPSAPLSPRISEPPRPAQASACAQQLRVNGLMMAENFRFRRTGGDSTAKFGPPSPSELFRFLGSIYLAPPPAFEDRLTPYATNPNYQDERPPVY